MTSMAVALDRNLFLAYYSILSFPPLLLIGHRTSLREVYKELLLILLPSHFSQRRSALPFHPVLSPTFFSFLVAFFSFFSFFFSLSYSLFSYSSPSSFPFPFPFPSPALSTTFFFSFYFSNSLLLYLHP